MALCRPAHKVDSGEVARSVQRPCPQIAGVDDARADSGDADVLPKGVVGVEVVAQLAQAGDENKCAADAVAEQVAMACDGA